jgi:hypothetical protein
VNIISTEKGTYDLSTNEGRYKYIAEFILSKGANGDIFSCLEKLFTEAKKIEELKELHRMQLVACSTAALANTEKSKEFRISKENSYWTPAYQDVCDAVDREISYREALKFYADKNNWIMRDDVQDVCINDSYQYQKHGIAVGGRRAREALKEIGE